MKINELLLSCSKEVRTVCRNIVTRNNLEAFIAIVTGKNRFKYIHLSMRYRPFS